MTCAESCCAGSREEQQERRKRPKNREPNPSLVVHRNLPPAKKLVVPICIFRNHKLTNPDLSPGLRARRSDEREFAPMRPFHDGRHTSITNAAAAGVTPAALMARAGHSDFATTQGYIDLAGETFREEAELAEERMLGQKSGQK